MTNEILFVLVIMAFAAAVTASIQINKHRHRIARVIADRIARGFKGRQRDIDAAEEVAADSKSRSLTLEEHTKAELERLEEIIEERKQIAREADVSYHLWSFYKGFIQNASSPSLDRIMQDGEWYDVKILKSSTANGLNKFEFELKGARYTFVDDEESKGWSDNIKSFSLFLYDDSDRCLIEIPMKLRVDRWGRNYSIQSNGPTAFLPDGWVNDFINVKLKHQRLRNQEIRDQKHQERLWEIEDLKARFGIED